MNSGGLLLVFLRILTKSRLHVELMGLQPCATTTLSTLKYDPGFHVSWVPGISYLNRELVPETRQLGPPSMYKRTISRPSAVTAMPLS